MSLKSTKLIFLDAQTTGMRPPAAQLIELAWSAGPADDPNPPSVHSHLVQLTEGRTLSRTVSEITGLNDSDLERGMSREELGLRLKASLNGVSAAAIHYAQFEKPFLLDLLGLPEFPIRVFCTYQLTKRLFPNLPSQNIRATAGFFGPPVLGLNRAGTFALATWQIWRGLCGELERQGLGDLNAVEDWLSKTPRAKATKYEYRIERFKRLELPDCPGVYRMLGKTGEVLYVGKATSLRSRVNSYFRGKKGRDRFKLEMLAQAWDLEITSCATALEAALLESDEIKRLDPPYNVALKAGNRHIVFYARDFSASGRAQSRDLPIGPFRGNNWIEHLRLLSISLKGIRFEQVFWNPLPEEDLRAGFELFCSLHGLQASQLSSVRSQLAFGMRLYRRHVEIEDAPEECAERVEENDGPAEEKPLTVEEIAGKFERLLRRAAAEAWRARRLTRLLNTRVEIGGRTLEFRHGRLDFSGETRKPAMPWGGLELDTFDRMSILLSELARLDHA